jgi:hypothetical protein
LGETSFSREQGCDEAGKPSCVQHCVHVLLVPLLCQSESDGQRALRVGPFALIREVGFGF